MKLRSNFSDLQKVGGGKNEVKNEKDAFEEHTLDAVKKCAP